MSAWWQRVASFNPLRRTQRTENQSNWQLFRRHFQREMEETKAINVNQTRNDDETRPGGRRAGYGCHGYRRSAESMK